MGARAELEVELKDHMAQLAEVDRRKDEFLATLAHELRNPLAPIKMAAMLARSNCGCGGSDRYLEMIERQADNLTRIVDDLVEVSRLTRGTIELRRERVALATVVTRALDSVRAQLEQRRHAVVVRLPDDPVTVMADPVRLEQVLQNILLNAARYTPPGGNIAIVVEVRGSLAEIRVRDDGIGIPAEDLSRVFDLFRQLPDGASGLPSGLGIGLTMARALVELHGGTIDASSSGPGMGSEFVIRLPLPASVPAAESVIPPPLEPAATRHRRVLVVDDNADAGEALEELLRTSGHVVRRVRDGRSALRAVQEFRPDVVLLDLAMPRMDGYEVARRIRTRHPRVRVVAVTGYSQPQHHRRAAESGITDLLVKPVRIDALQRLLDGAALHSGPNLENPPTHDPVSGPTGRAAV
jgi:CheY-like chemotaxis protein